MENIFITLDYELYFGSKSGSQSNSIIKPTEALLKILEKHKVKGCFFVDVGYILKLEEYKTENRKLEDDYQELMIQLEHLAKSGHDLQLHIHPHWEDSYHDGERWIMNTERFRIHKFEIKEIENIVIRYKNKLEEVSGKKVFCFRAGGWCIQPFDQLKSVFKDIGITIDSTVFRGGYNHSNTHYFDFKDAPTGSQWKFNDDPLKIENNGGFLEIPISSHKVSPLFFWKFIFNKFLGGKKHIGFGDGTAAGGSMKDKFRMLTRFSYSVVSIDGYKSSFLRKAYFDQIDHQNFVMIGHPKALTRYSLKKLDNFLKEIDLKKVTTYTNWEIENGE